MKLILKYGFELLGLHKIKLDVFEINIGGIKIYEKCGFKIVGRQKEEIYINGKYLDRIQMEILRRDYF